MPFVFLIQFTIATVVTLLVSVWTDRTVEFWLSLINGEHIDVPFILSVVITICLNGVAFGVNVISELLRLVM